jgi:hypothetical protein
MGGPYCTIHFPEIFGLSHSCTLRLVQLAVQALCGSELAVAETRDLIYKQIIREEVRYD